MGQRFATLAALKRAAEVRVDADLRTQAFAALMLPDVQVQHTWEDRYGSSSPAAFDSTLERYVVESGPGILTLRRARDQHELMQLATPAGNPRVLYIAAWSADDARVAARFANDVVRVFDATSGAMLFELTERPVSSSGRAFAYDFGFTPDGQQLAVGLPGGGVSFHDANSGGETARLASATVPSAVAFSPDGAKLAMVAKNSPNVEVYDRASGVLEQTLVHPEIVFHLAWRPGEQHQLATSSRDNRIYIWNTATGGRLHSLGGHDGIPPLIAFHPAGRLLASTSRDFTVRFWDVETGSCVLNAHGIYGEPVLRFSRDGEKLALGSEGAGLSVARFAMDEPCREFFRCERSDWHGGERRRAADRHHVAFVWCAPAVGRERECRGANSAVARRGEDRRLHACGGRVARERRTCWLVALPALAQWR
jgi:hypothetical protein